MEQEHQKPEEELSFAELLVPSIPAEEPPQPTEQPSEPESEQPKEKPSKKRLLLGISAAVTALAVTIGATFLLAPEKPTPAPVSDGGFYLLTKATEYHPDGKPGYCQTTYTYDQRGFPLSVFVDRGRAGEEVWNDEAGIFETLYTSFDGKADTLVEFVYNEKGDILYRLETQNTYDPQGELVTSETDRNDQYQNHQYHYTTDGKIESVDVYNTKIGGGTGDLGMNLTYHYNDAGKVLEVYKTKGRTEGYVFDFRYDAEGRLTAATNRPKEGIFLYRYEYDDAGRLTKVDSMHAGGSEFAYIDTECVNHPEFVFPAIFRNEQQARFTYDGDGRLISRCVYAEDERLMSRTDCEYENGQLSKVTYRENGRDTVYRYAENGNGQDITLVRDINGNIIRQIRPDGSYIEYEYQRFDLTEENIQRAKNVQYLLNQVDALGDTAPYYNTVLPIFEGGYAFLADVPYPTTVLYETDILRHE